MPAVTVWGENIARILRERKLKQGMIAERAGLNPSRLSDIINKDNTNPNIRTLERIAEALDVSLADLLRQKGTVHAAPVAPVGSQVRAELLDVLIDMFREAHAALVTTKAREAVPHKSRRQTASDGDDESDIA